MLPRSFPLAPLALLALSACAQAPPTPPAPPEEVRTKSRLAAVYVHAPHDKSRHRDTCKVWHEVYAPDGRLLTKGLGGSFEHHRGLFFGHNLVRRGEQSFDFWHCGDEVSQRHVSFAPPRALGLRGDWQVAAIDWCDKDGEAVVRELRGLRAFDDAPNRLRLELVIRIEAAQHPVELAGDPQHSGQQFRALQAFAADDGPKVRYLRPPSAEAAGNDVWTGCDWIAAVLPLPDGDVTVLRVEHDGNPKPVRWSTRDYGRFGASFAARLEPGAPLELRYTYVIALGALPVATCAALAADARGGPPARAMR